MSGTMFTPQHATALAAVHNQAQARFDATSKAQSMMQIVGAELQSLLQLGDTVTPEDVIQGTGKLVAAGGQPAALAALLADMPTSGGQPLEAWLAAQAQRFGQQQAAVQQAHQLARHQLGVSALHQMAADAARPGAARPPAAAPNPLAPAAAGVPANAT